MPQAPLRTHSVTSMGFSCSLCNTVSRRSCTASQSCKTSVCSHSTPMPLEGLGTGRNDCPDAPSILVVGDGCAIFAHSSSHAVVFAEFRRRDLRRSCTLSLARSGPPFARHATALSCRRLSLPPPEGKEIDKKRLSIQVSLLI